MYNKVRISVWRWAVFRQIFMLPIYDHRKRVIVVSLSWTHCATGNVIDRFVNVTCCQRAPIVVNRWKWYIKIWTYRVPVVFKNNLFVFPVPNTTYLHIFLYNRYVGNLSPTRNKKFSVLVECIDLWNWCVFFDKTKKQKTKKKNLPKNLWILSNVKNTISW